MSSRDAENATRGVEGAHEQDCNVEDLIIMSICIQGFSLSLSLSVGGVKDCEQQSWLGVT